MAQPVPRGAWSGDPADTSILVATGRSRHDLFVVAEPAMLTSLDASWGPPLRSVRLSSLPGVSAPATAGQEDSLVAYRRDGLSVLIARGRTSPLEGKPADLTTALAQMVGARGVRAALLLTRATSLGAAVPGDLLAVGDHLNLSGAALFSAERTMSGAWHGGLTARLGRLRGVRGTGVVALIPGPMRPTPAEARILDGMGADAVVFDTVAEGMALAARGVPTTALAVIDDAVASPGSQPSGRRAAAPDPRLRRPAASVVLDAVETVLATLHR
ncbi:hypothetical protein ACSL103130_11130 [Actinomyces slackii]|uniref:Purine nucleoside phosphorylase 1 n=1 Tax=Actinomyces slackii TaxID=52774 RepID=A0A448KAS4_9ACTO|nr:hypothetical protein [Actinomyces slackii]VEG74020.1 Purine nucleoside phosphorylase 1 [Actinomyces slackii]